MGQSTLELQLNLGESLALARKARGQTQAELANESGLSRATIAKIEAGDADPKLTTISEIAKALNVSPAWLLMSEEDLEIIAEIAESGDLSNILEMLPDELMTWVNSMVGSGRKKNIREALDAIESVFKETEDTDDLSVDLKKTPENVSDEEMSSMLKAIVKAGAAVSSTTLIGAGLSSKIGTAVGTAWWKAKSKLRDDQGDKDS